MKRTTPMNNQTSSRSLPTGFGNAAGMSKFALALAALLLLTTAASASIRNRISLLSGTLAGQAIGGGTYEISVAPGSNIVGSLDVLVHNEMPDSAIAPVAATTTWGMPQDSYWCATDSAPTGDSTQHVAVNVTAPLDEGVYYIVVAMAGTYNCDQIMSGTHPAWPADWTNGNKVALLPRCDFESAARNGWIPFAWYTPNGPSAGEMAMTVVRVIVPGNYLIKLGLQTGTLAGQSIDSTHREIKVAPGTAINGSFNVLVQNGLPGSAIAPVAATSTWGDPPTSYWCVEPWAPTGDSVVTVNTPANLVAPLTPGTYYIAVGMAGTYDCAQIMSGTHPAYPPDWQHGNLVAHLPACDFELAALLGYIPFDWYVPPSGSSRGWMAMTTVKVEVVSPVQYGKIVANIYPNELRIIDTIDHTNITVPLPPELRPAFPNWSCDGQWIAFAAFSTTNQYLTQIYVVHPDGTGLRQVSDGTKNVVYPAFSPDCTKIACTGVEGDGDIYILNFDGSGTTNLGVSINVSQVKWSPDGQKLLYDNWGFSYYACDLFVYDIATRTSTALTHHQDESFVRGSWSPDGTRIVCSHYTTNANSWSVCVMNADGSNPVDIAPEGSQGPSDPSWSPDGQYIIYTSNQDGHSDIWSMWPDGTQRTNLTHSAPDDYSHPDMLLVGPRIDLQPISQTATLGGSVTFSVTAVGSTPLHYQWQFNGVDINGATGSTLTLTGLKASDAGSYRVVVTNSRGSLISADAILSFLSLRMYAGLTLSSPVPMTYRIQCKNSLSQADWTTLGIVTVTNSPYLWIDPNSPDYPSRFYLAVPMP